MSKTYFEIGSHGYNGQFYICDEQSGAFRADNLAIATKIAFNNYLRDFDNLGHECSLVSITDGEFTVQTDQGRETYTVSHYGPADVFTVEHAHKIGSDAYQKMYQKMIEMADSGDSRVRRSKRSGLLMFTCQFPRYRKNGEWWDREHSYLSTDLDLAIEQWAYVLATDDEQQSICDRNCAAMCKRKGLN